MNGTSIVGKFHVVETSKLVDFHSTTDCSMLAISRQSGVDMQPRGNRAALPKKPLRKLRLTLTLDTTRFKCSNLKPTCDVMTLGFFAQTRTRRRALHSTFSESSLCFPLSSVLRAPQGLEANSIWFCQAWGLKKHELKSNSSFEHINSASA